MESFNDRINREYAEKREVSMENKSKIDVHFIELYRINHLTLQHVGLVIEEIYKHCLDRKLSLIDTKFADWFLKDHLLNRY